MPILNRVGLFGGTFNPIHFGHLRTALETLEGFGLDQIRFIPAADPPHKDKTDLADESDRLAMLTQAIENNPLFSVSDIELRRPGRSYTIDTVRQFTREKLPSTQCFLIIGLDAFMDISTWKEYKEILKNIPLIVMSRPDENEPFMNRNFSGIGEYMENRISTGFVFNKEQNAFVHKSLKPIYIFPVTSLHISATTIRQHVRQGRSIRYLVPDSVATYIHDKRLYT